MVTMIRPAARQKPGGGISVPYADDELLARFAGVRKLPCKIRSPFREDSHASVSLSRKGGSVLWHDFATGEGGDALDFVARLWNVCRSECARMVAEGAGLATETERAYATRPKARRCGVSDIQCRTRMWNMDDLGWWSGFGVTAATLARCDVHPVSDIIVRREDGSESYMKAEPLAYAYYEWDASGARRVKVYQPLSSEMKWIGKQRADTLCLSRQAERSLRGLRNDLVLTSSVKDAMCLMDCLGVVAVAPPGEGVMPDRARMDALSSLAGRTFVWYDNDRGDVNWGQRDAAKVLSRWPSFANVCVPDALGCKDPSDLVKYRGREALRGLWRNVAHDK